MRKMVARQEPRPLAPWQGAQLLRYARWTGVAFFGTGWGRKRRARTLPPTRRRLGARMMSSHFALTAGRIARRGSRASRGRAAGGVSPQPFTAPAVRPET